MNRQRHTTLGACALPLLLALAAQGGSCRDGGAGDGPRAGSAAASNASKARAANAGAGAGQRAAKNANAANVNTAGAAADADHRGSEAGMGQGGDSGGAAPVAWGGTGVRLEVGAGGGKVEFDCAHGTLGKVAPDAEGGFDVGGTFVRERGGPVRSDEQPEKLPARYRGKIEGESMTLRVSVEGLGETLTYTLTRGRTARLRKCL